jgi:hypothetical protein
MSEVENPSPGTRERLVEALREHVAACSGGGYLTDFVVIAAVAMPADADSTTYVTETSDGPVHHRAGLVRYLSRRTDQLITEDQS